VIEMAFRILKELNLEKKIELQINSLGDFQSRNSYSSVLSEFLSKYKNHLSIDSQQRYGFYF